MFVRKIFPPAFFDIMVHLTVHLVREVKLYGPVYLRWMYPFERYMKILKGYVSNHNRPEGSIVEGYIAEEAVEFCSEYLLRAQAIGVPKPRYDPNKDGEALRGEGVIINVDRPQWAQAHSVVLQNTTEIIPYIE